jgi:hypothetical protein
MRRLGNRYTQREDVLTFAREAEEMVERYGWQERETHPYGFPVKVAKIINNLKDYDLYERGSQEHLAMYVNPLGEILEAWERHELAPKIKVRSLKTGKVAEIRAEDLDIFEGWVEVI